MKTSENKKIRDKIKIIKVRIKEKQEMCEKFDRFCDRLYRELSVLEATETRLKQTWEDGQ